MTELQMDHKTIKIYQAEGRNLPVIYSNDYGESGTEVLKCCRELACPPFHLVTVSGLDWEENMSPWPAEPVVTKKDHFSGGGPAYLEWLLSEAVPAAEQVLRDGETAGDAGEDSTGNDIGAESYIAGYSMAGLFALWSLYETDFFKGAVSASGSLWYPGFCDYAVSHSFKGTPRHVYLSLGDRESLSRNPVLKTAETSCRRLEAFYRNQGTDVIFELNQGSHYKDAELRMSMGIRWLLQQTVI